MLSIIPVLLLAETGYLHSKGGIISRVPVFIRTVARHFEIEMKVTSQIPVLVASKVLDIEGFCSSGLCDGNL